MSTLLENDDFTDLHPSDSDLLALQARELWISLMNQCYDELAVDPDYSFDWTPSLPLPIRRMCRLRRDETASEAAQSFDDISLIELAHPENGPSEFCFTNDLERGVRCQPLRTARRREQLANLTCEHYISDPSAVEESLFYRLSRLTAEFDYGSADDNGLPLLRRLQLIDASLAFSPFGVV